MEVKYKMAVVVASGTAFAIGANLKSTDRVSGQYQNVQKGKLTLVCYPAENGLMASLSVGGITLINDLEVPWFGTTGSMDLSAHVVLSQEILGGKIELYFRETDGSATQTADYVLLFEPA